MRPPYLVSSPIDAITDPFVKTFSVQKLWKHVFGWFCHNGRHEKSPGEGANFRSFFVEIIAIFFSIYPILIRESVCMNFFCSVKSISSKNTSNMLIITSLHHSISYQLLSPVFSLSFIAKRFRVLR